ncbi:hypothetical protein VNO80_25743 [Phaseolus coccineus]|uniref:Uncharacterized protein n=1 Tax=Phaseolus coccineus TaxID=3886 RepID=A0AAN9LZW8_PHACN
MLKPNIEDSIILVDCCIVMDNAAYKLSGSLENVVRGSPANVNDLVPPSGDSGKRNKKRKERTPRRPPKDTPRLRVASTSSISWCNNQIIHYSKNAYLEEKDQRRATDMKKLEDCLNDSNLVREEVVVGKMVIEAELRN